MRSHRGPSVLALGVLLALACGACGTGYDTGPTGPETSEMTIRVQGTITSAEDGQPVPGAWVRLLEWASLEAGHLNSCAWASTDANGFFSLSCSGRSCLLIPGGHLSGPLIAAGAAGFEILFPVVTDCTNDPQVFNLTLAPAAAGEEEGFRPGLVAVVQTFRRQSELPPPRARAGDTAHP